MCYSNPDISNIQLSLTHCLCLLVYTQSGLPTTVLPSANLETITVNGELECPIIFGSVTTQIASGNPVRYYSIIVERYIQSPYSLHVSYLLISSYDHIEELQYDGLCTLLWRCSHILYCNLQPCRFSYQLFNLYTQNRANKKRYEFHELLRGRMYDDPLVKGGLKSIEKVT